MYPFSLSILHIRFMSTKYSFGRTSRMSNRGEDKRQAKLSTCSLRRSNFARRNLVVELSPLQWILICSRLSTVRSKALTSSQNGTSMGHLLVKLPVTTLMSTSGQWPSTRIPSVALLTFSFCARPGTLMEVLTSSTIATRPRD